MLLRKRRSSHAQVAPTALSCFVGLQSLHASAGEELFPGTGVPLGKSGHLSPGAQSW